MKPRLAACYALLVVMLMCALTIWASLIASRGRAHDVIPRITNSTHPNDVERHFGKPRQTFSSTMLGLPDDGTCADYSNGVSWRVLVCFGTQPESQP